MKTHISLGAIVALAFLLGFASGRGVATEPGAGNDASGAGTEAGMVNTDSLVVDFYQAWNDDDLPGMVSRLQPTAFFRSPYQLQYGRDTMQATVLVTNPPRFRNTTTTEWHSYASEALAWSIGELTSEVHDESGVRTGESLESEYLHVFTPSEDGAWKVQMLVYHEACG